MKISIILFVFSVITANRCYAMYDARSDVIELTDSNFENKVANSEDVWVVEFYAPWCGHCQAFATEYSKAATALKGIVRVAGVDCDQHKSVCGQYGIRGFPTVKIFGRNKKVPSDYNQGRNSHGIVDAAFRYLREVVDERLSGKKSSSGGGGGSESKRPKGDKKDVIELTDSNFNDLVIKSDDVWLVEFFAPWCGHCKNLEPHWREAASALKGKVKLGAVDATVHTIVASKYGVQGYPTIKFFPGGKKDGAEEYDGGRTASDIINWANEKYLENVPPPELQELTNSAVLKEGCQDKQLCVVSVLPPLLDCQSGCRNKYLQTLRDLTSKYKRNPWGWIWTEALLHPKLEDSLEIGGFGYPAMSVINIRKMKYSLLRGSFSYEGINEFLREVSFGKGSSAPIKGAELPEINKVEPWDGKDAELPKEEEIDLSDVDLDGSKKEEL